MRILVIGGTGNISTALVRQLVERGQDEITVFNRGQRSAEIPDVTTVVGDRYDHNAFVQRIRDLGTFDCVIDMICYNTRDARSLLRAIEGRCGQLIFCSTVDVYRKPAWVYPITEEGCPYDTKTPWEYASNKVACERMLWDAMPQATIIRPVQTYGGLWVLDSLSTPTPRHLGRMMAGKPIVVHGDGLSLWGAVHRDDCARAFVGAIGNDRALGKAYHTSPDETMTWSEYQRQAAVAIDAPEPELVKIPVDLLARRTPRAFVTSVNFAFNNCFDNTAAKRDLGFEYRVSWRDGVTAAYQAFLRGGGTLDHGDDPEYEAIVADWARAGEGFVGG